MHGGDGWWTRPAAAWRRFDTVAAALLALLVAVRWTDRARWLLSWDSYTFAIALEHYDLRALTPHAPGYPVYVALGRSVDWVVHDAATSLVFLSLLCTATTVVALYGLGRDLAGRAVGLAAALLLLAAPLAYVHSVTANAYTAEMAGSVLVAWAALRARRDPSPRRILVLAVALALAIGVRPSLAIYLAPVALWAALRPAGTVREQARRLGPGLAAGVAVCLAWFLPMLRHSGGYAGWSEANRLQTGGVVFQRTLFNDGLPAVRENVDRLGLYLHWELRFVLPIAAALLVVGLVARRRLGAWAEGPAFLAAWLAPPLLFFATVYTGFNDGPSGYALAVLPGLLLAACMLGRWALTATPWPPRVTAVAAVACVVVAAFGLTGHRYDVRDVGYKQHDAWAEQWSHLPEAFPPSNTTIVASWDFAHVWHSFPEYTTYDYRPAATGPGEVPDFLLIQEAHEHKAAPRWYDALSERRTAGPHVLPNGTEILVLFNFQLAGEGGPRQVRDDVQVHEAFLPSGWRVLLVRTTPDRPHLEDYFRMDGALADGALRP